ncbi:MAG: ABC transporter ATP-binding protein [Actinomycetes bacterium]|jgi:putative spermidine/putrescine transport system ATP-binding protein
MSANNVESKVSLQNLSKHYGDVAALVDFSLEMRTGEMVSLLGPSGCGKTTVLRILGGLDPEHGGQIHVDGENITGSTSDKRNMGMVFQAYSLFPNMTVAENVEYGLRVRKIAPEIRRKKSMELLEMVHLSHRPDAYPNQLSGGQQQRVALARALAIAPKVLLLDEPLSALDAQVRVQIREEIRRIQLETQTTTLFVTHDQEEAMSVSDRVGVMNAGQLEQIDSPSNLYNKPKSAFVASFVGVTNKISAQIGGNGRVKVFNQDIELSKNSAEFGSGAAVIALVRPENISIASDGDPESKSGLIITKSFLGPMTKLGLDLGGENLVYVNLTSQDAKRIDVGNRVAVKITSEELMVANA